MPQTTKKENILPNGQTELIKDNAVDVYTNSVVELKNTSKLVINNLQSIGTSAITTAVVNTIKFNTDNVTVPNEEGHVFWDDQDRTLSAMMAGGNVKLQIGQEMYIRGVNKTGTTVSNGTLVYISGAQGNRPEISVADNTEHDNANRTIGMATEDIANNAYGYVTTQGIVRDLNTSDYTEGDCLYLSTAGAYTTVTPSDGTIRTKVGIVLKSHNNDGWIYCCIKDDKYMFGDVDNSNYANFESDGFLKFNGNGTYWRDIDFPIIIRQTGPGIPTLDTVTGNLTAPKWQVNDNNMCESQEFVHEWKEGSRVYFHLHQTTNGQEAVPKYVKWQVEYSYVTVNGTWSTATTTSSEIEIPANTPDRTMTIAPIANFEPTGVKIGGHILAKLTRIASTGTAPTNDPFCAMLQLHVECDSGGSRAMTTK